MNQTVMHNVEGVDLSGVVSGSDTTAISSVADVVAAREVSAEEMFGAQSRIVEVVDRAEPMQTLVGDWLFQLLSVVLLFAVVLFIARHRRRVSNMLVRLLKGHLPDDYASGRRDEVLTRTFLHTSSFIGIMLLTLFCVKYAPMWMPESLIPSEGWMSTVAALYVLVGVVAIALFEYALLWVVGKVTRGEEVVGAILYMKRSGFSLAAIALSPIFLMGVLSSENLTGSWNIVLFVECSILVLLFIKETRALFIEKKIPIFHWILYLCTVEAFPLSLIWALIVRS